jgi:hypothetical protein
MALVQAAVRQMISGDNKPARVILFARSSSAGEAMKAEVP